MQPEMTEAKKVEHFHVHLEDQAFEILKPILSSAPKTLREISRNSKRKLLTHNQQLQLKTNSTN